MLKCARTMLLSFENKTFKDKCCLSGVFSNNLDLVEHNYREYSVNCEKKNVLTLMPFNSLVFLIICSSRDIYQNYLV